MGNDTSFVWREGPRASPQHGYQHLNLTRKNSWKAEFKFALRGYEKTTGEKIINVEI